MQRTLPPAQIEACRRRTCAALAVSLALALALAGVADAAAPANNPRRIADCLDERFAEAAAPYHSVRFREATAPSMISADDRCLDGDPTACKSREPLGRSRQWFAGAQRGSWVCVTDGLSFGWTSLDQVELGPLPATQPQDWLGRWRRESGQAEIVIEAARQGQAFHVAGNAEWLAGPEAMPHVGDIDSEGEPQANVLELGDPKCLDREYGEERDECLDCVARLMLLDGRLFVVDNHNCGGMNVNFDGIYSRVPARDDARRR